MTTATNFSFSEDLSMFRSNFFVVTFVDSNGQHQVGRTFSQIRNARKSAKDVAKFGTNVRIMKGGPGGMEVF